MTTATTRFPTFPTSNNNSSTSTNTSDPDTSGVGTNQTLVIALSTVLSVIVTLLVVGVLLFLCWRCRQRVSFCRGISPIDDDEIATWKMSRSEKAALDGVDEAPARASRSSRPSRPTPSTAEPRRSTALGEGPSRSLYSMGIPNSPRKHSSLGSMRKPASVIVYSNPEGQGRWSSENSPRHQGARADSFGGRMSLDKDLPQTPIQARAPNARAGLTDDAVPGDEPYIACPKRQSSRLSKLPLSSSPRSTHGRHARSRSSRSSLRSWGEYGSSGGAGWFEFELSPRASHEHIHRPSPARSASRTGSAGGGGIGHSRVYSSSSVPPPPPPPSSLGNEAPAAGGLSRWPLIREADIVRVVG